MLIVVVTSAAWDSRQFESLTSISAALPCESSLLPSSNMYHSPISSFSRLG